MIFYAVQKGRVPGVYQREDELMKQIEGFKGAKWKGFANYNKAIGYVDNTKLYVVKKGIKPGIYENYEKAKCQVKGVPGGSLRGFFTLEEAERFLETLDYKLQREPKYYAVKYGKTPGIYKPSKDAQKQVKGYKGQLFKIFNHIEYAYLFLENPEKPTGYYSVTKGKKIGIYRHFKYARAQTDGFPHGRFIRFGKLEDAMKDFKKECPEIKSPYIQSLEQLKVNYRSVLKTFPPTKTVYHVESSSELETPAAETTTEVETASETDDLSTASSHWSSSSTSGFGSTTPTQIYTSDYDSATTDTETDSHGPKHGNYYSLQNRNSHITHPHNSSRVSRIANSGSLGTDTELENDNENSSDFDTEQEEMNSENVSTEGEEGDENSGVLEAGYHTAGEEDNELNNELESLNISDTPDNSGVGLLS